MEAKIQLQPGQYYHIYNHANGFDDFFIDEFDYQKFLDRYAMYIAPICETFAYCLMPNHFHFFVQIKPLSELIKYLRIKPTNPEINSRTDFSIHPAFGGSLAIGSSPEIDSDTISYQFSHCFNSYAQSFNKKHGRKGSLFRSTFKRKPVDSKKYFVKLVHYIHSNPVKDGFAKTIEQWEYSSYNHYLYDTGKFLNKAQVLEYFGGIASFKQVHEQPFDYSILIKNKL